MGIVLAQIQTPKTTYSEAKTWLLPRRAIFELKKILETIQDTTLFLGMCGNQLVFSGEQFNFFTKILADQFPNYRTILDKNAFVPATIDRSRFLKTLRRSVCLLSNQFIATKFTFATIMYAFRCKIKKWAHSMNSFNLWDLQKQKWIFACTPRIY